MIDVPISVVVPAYNAAGHLGAALATVREQCVRPLEIVVVDDASSDATATIAASFGARVVRHERNRGPAAARNRGVREARAPWIAFLDADDLWRSDKLERQWRALASHRPSLCLTDYEVIESNGHRTRRAMACEHAYRRMLAFAREPGVAWVTGERFGAALVRTMFARQSSIVVERERFLASGGYAEAWTLAEDYEWLLRTAGGTVAIVTAACVSYRRRRGSLSDDPLRELASIDRLWDHIERDPVRYPAAVVDAVRRQRAATLRRGVRTALRLGRPADGFPFVDAGLRRTPLAVSLHGWRLLAHAMATPAGARAHRSARSLWRKAKMAGTFGV